jgi:hypothetical protein
MARSGPSLWSSGKTLKHQEKGPAITPGLTKESGWISAFEED